MHKIYLAIIGVLLVAGGAYVATSDNVAQNNAQDEYVVDASDYVVPHPYVSELPKEAISTSERDGLIMMREEEKLAHDVYITLYDKWGINIFRNIASSEQTHTESVRYLLERYDIADPVQHETVGEFTNSDFTELYNALVAQGSQSLTDALTVGATIEDLDINDLQELMAQTDNQDIIAVYENLVRGSRNHLRAFSRQLERQGASYTAQYISQEEVDDILSGSQERGNRPW